MNKFIQFITNWRNIVAIILMGVVIASVYYKWKTVISIGWILTISYFVYRLYKDRPFLKSKA